MKTAISLMALIVATACLHAHAYEQEDVEVTFTAQIMTYDHFTGGVWPSQELFYLFKDGQFCECSNYEVGESDHAELRREEPGRFGTWRKTKEGYLLKYPDEEVLFAFDEIGEFKN